MIISGPDGSLQRLLDLDGEIMDMGDGYRVKIEVRKVDPSPKRPHGINYSLCLFSPEGERVIGFDNAHPVAIGTSPARKLSATNDHTHKGSWIRPYDYVDAETLMSDFWTDVDKMLKSKGVR